MRGKQQAAATGRRESTAKLVEIETYRRNIVALTTERDRLRGELRAEGAALQQRADAVPSHLTAVSEDYDWYDALTIALDASGADAETILLAHLDAAHRRITNPHDLGPVVKALFGAFDEYASLVVRRLATRTGRS